MPEETTRAASQPTFPIIDDRTGERKVVTAREFDDKYQGEGWRVADPQRYAAAVPPFVPPAPEPTAAQKRMAEQGRADATAAHQEQYPDAKPGEADKPAKPSKAAGAADKD